ncbi:MAG: CopD family protein [Pseudomonadota bacterium]
MADPHLLDGMLARALAYAGTAAMTGPATWRLLTGAVAAHARALRIGGLAAACGSAALALHATTLMAFTAFVPDDSGLLELAETRIGPGDYATVLRDTAYGHAWLAYVGALLLLTGYGRLSRAWPRAQAWGTWLLGLGALGALALMGHAGEWGAGSTLFAVDLLHLTAVTAWLGGFMVLVLGRFGTGERVLPPALRAFSRFAAPAMLVAVGSGIGRLALQEVGLDALAHSAYGWVLAGKLLALLGVLLSAYGLRRWLRAVHEPAAAQWRTFDDRLSAEIFFAALLLLAAALLTQLPPPPSYPASSAARFHPTDAVARLCAPPRAADADGRAAAGCRAPGPGNAPAWGASA